MVQVRPPSNCPPTTRASSERAEGAVGSVQMPDHTPARVAEQGRCGPPLDFDVVHFTEIQICELALTIGKGLWNAIHQDLDPTDREGRPGPCPSDRQLLIEREVVAVLVDDAGDSAQGLVQPPRGTGRVDIGAGDRCDRGRGAGEGTVRAGGESDDGGKGVFGNAVRVLGDQTRGHEPAGNRDPGEAHAATTDVGRTGSSGCGRARAPC